jgi:hypothetical protein
MLTPLVTLVFLSVLWLAAAVILGMFAGTGPRIIAALRGEMPALAGTSPVLQARSSRCARLTRHQPPRIQPQLRAAA